MKFSLSMPTMSESCCFVTTKSPNLLVSGLGLALLMLILVRCWLLQKFIASRKNRSWRTWVDAFPNRLGLYAWSNSAYSLPCLSYSCSQSQQYSLQGSLGLELAGQQLSKSSKRLLSWMLSTSKSSYLLVPLGLGQSPWIVNDSPSHSLRLQVSHLPDLKQKPPSQDAAKLPEQGFLASGNLQRRDSQFWPRTRVRRRAERSIWIDFIQICKICYVIRHLYVCRFKRYNHKISYLQHLDSSKQQFEFWIFAVVILEKIQSQVYADCCISSRLKFQVFQAIFRNFPISTDRLHIKQNGI